MTNDTKIKELTVGDNIQVMRRKHKIKRSEYLSEGVVPVIDQGVQFIAGYIDEEDRAYDDPLPVIVFGDHTCALKYVDFRFAVGADGTQLIRPKNDGELYHRYLYYCLRNVSLEQFGYQRHFKYLKESKIPWWTMAVQRKITAILSRYDDLIENNTRRIQIIEEMAQTIYREWFVHFRFPGHERVRMVESEMGLIPEGWEVKTIKDICELINYGYTAKANEKCVGPKFLRITDIVPYLIDWDSVPYCEIEKEKLNKYTLEEGDIVIARTGATTGYAKRINKRHPEAIFASYLVRIRIKREYSSLWAGLIVESDEYKTFIKTNISGAAQPNANAQVLISFPIIIPPKEVPNKFDAAIGELLDQRELLQDRNRILRKTRDLLLPKLISGEIDVSELDIDISEV